MADAKQGIQAALDAVGAGAPPVEAAEQLPLLPLGEPLAAAGAAPAVRRGPGRPPGSSNRRTEDWARYLLTRYASPLEVLAQAITRPTAELAGELRCDRVDAFKLQLDAAKALAPYLHQAQPRAVQLDAKGVPVLVIGSLDGGPEAPGGVLDGVATIIDENEGKSDA